MGVIRRIVVTADGELLRVTSNSGPAVELLGRIVITMDNQVVRVGTDERAGLRELEAHPGSRIVKPLHPVEGDVDAAGALLRYAAAKADRLADVGLLKAAFGSAAQVTVEDWAERDTRARRTLARGLVSAFWARATINGTVVAARSRLDQLRGRKARIVF